MSPHAVSGFVLVLVAVVSLLDFYLLWDGIADNTFSARIRAWGEDIRWLPYTITAFLGALATHWFAKGERRNRLSLLVGLVLSILVGMGIGLFW